MADILRRTFDIHLNSFGIFKIFLLLCWKGMKYSPFEWLIYLKIFQGLQKLKSCPCLVKNRGSKGCRLDFSVIFKLLSFMDIRFCLLFIIWPHHLSGQKIFKVPKTQILPWTRPKSFAPRPRAINQVNTNLDIQHCDF